MVKLLQEFYNEKSKYASNKKKNTMNQAIVTFYIMMLHTVAGKAVSANIPPLVCERLFLTVFKSRIVAPAFANCSVIWKKGRICANGNDSEDKRGHIVALSLSSPIFFASGCIERRATLLLPCNTVNKLRVILQMATITVNAW